MLVNDFALFVHDVVIFQKLFANIEVMRFDLLLGILDCPGDHPVLDGHTFFHAKFQHET